MEWQWETQKKSEKRELGKDKWCNQMGQDLKGWSTLDKWDRDKGVFRSSWDKWDKDGGVFGWDSGQVSVQLNQSTCPKVGLQGRGKNRWTPKQLGRTSPKAGPTCPNKSSRPPRCRQIWNQVKYSDYTIFLNSRTGRSVEDETQNAELRVDLNPLKKKFTRSWVRNVRINFRILFLNWYKKRVKIIFRTCFGLVISVRARGHCESSCRSARR